MKLSLLIAIAALLVSTGCNKKTAAPAQAAPEVEVIQVEPRDVPIFKEWVGTVDGSNNAQIRPQVSGYLLKRSYQEGTVVKKDDLLFEIDPRQFQAALDKAAAELVESEARQVKTQQDVDRYTPLAKEQAISQQELDDAVQANLGAKAAINSSKAALEHAKLNLNFTRIISPIDGVAGAAKGQVGDLVGPETVLTTISTLDPAKVNFPISEQEYLGVAERVNKAVDKPASERNAIFELILTDGSVYPQKGTISNAGREVDPKTGTMRLSAVFPNPGNILRPGQYAKVRAAVNHKNGALAVPQRAVSEMQGIFQVAVVGSDNKVSIRAVKTAERIGSEWIISEGLQPGERVVAEGLLKVKDGMTVVPKTAAPNAT